MRYFVGLGALLATAAPLAAQGRPASAAGTIFGSVTAAHNSFPLEGARIRVDPGVRSVLTDATGRFRVPDLPPGRYLVRANMLGYEALSVEVDVSPGQSIELAFEPGFVGDTLPPIEVRGRNPRLRDVGADFYRRKLENHGYILDQEEIQRRHAPNVPELLRSVPGVKVYCRAGTLCSVRIRRNSALSPQRALACPPRYFLNGVPEDSLVVNFIRPDDLYGVEVYRGPSETPPELNVRGAECGVIVFWMRTR